MMYRTRRYKDTDIGYQISKQLAKEITHEIDREILNMLNSTSTKMSDKTSKKVEDILREPANPTQALKDLMSRGNNDVG